MADDEQPDGAIGWKRARDVERRELAAGGFGGEVDGERRVIPNVEGVEIFRTEVGENATTRDAAAAATTDNGQLPTPNVLRRLGAFLAGSAA